MVPTRQDIPGHVGRLLGVVIYDPSLALQLIHLAFRICACGPEVAESPPTPLIDEPRKLLA